MEKEVAVVKTDVSTKHQIVIVVLGALAGFAAGKLVERSYVGGLARIQNRNANTSE